jgi:hypothetical protein
LRRAPFQGTVLAYTPKGARFFENRFKKTEYYKISKIIIAYIAFSGIPRKSELVTDCYSNNCYKNMEIHVSPHLARFRRKQQKKNNGHLDARSASYDKFHTAAAKTKRRRGTIESRV